MTTCNSKKLCCYDSWHFADVKVMFVTIFTHQVWPYLINFFTFPCEHEQTYETCDQTHTLWGKKVENIWTMDYNL